MINIYRRLLLMEMYTWNEFSEETVEQFTEYFGGQSEDEKERLLDQIYSVPNLTEKEFVEMFSFLNVDLSEKPKKNPPQSLSMMELYHDLQKEMIDINYEKQKDEWFRVSKVFYRFGFQVYAKLHKQESILDMFSEIQGEKHLQECLKRRPTELETYEYTRLKYRHILEKGIRFVEILFEEMIKDSISTDVIMGLAEWVVSIYPGWQGEEQFSKALRVLKYAFGTSEFSLDMFIAKIPDKEELEHRAEIVSATDSLFRYQFTSMNSFPFDYPEDFEGWEYSHPEEAKYQRERHGWTDDSDEEYEDEE